MTQPLCFATKRYQYFLDWLVRCSTWQAGTIDTKTFPDGEAYHRIASDCADRDCILIGGTISDADTVELFDIACGLVQYGASRLSLVIPYFGHATMERATLPGEVVTAKTRARILSAIPSASQGTQVFLLDLHTEGVAHYFEGNLRPVHMYGKPLVLAQARALAATATANELVLACTDAGRAKWVESLANDLGVPAAFVYKRRLSGSETEVTGVSANVRDKHVIIYDDMIRTGGSLLAAARAYREAGAATIDAITTHGVFPGDSLKRLLGSQLLRTVVATDSHPRANELQAHGLTVCSIDSLVWEHLRTNR